MVRQAKIFTTLMENFDTVNRSVATSLNSAGSAMRENEVYTQSLEGKINALKSSFEQLATTTINSDMVKGIIDMATEMIKFVDACGGLIPILTTILGIVITLKANKISNWIEGAVVSIGSIGKAMLGLTTVTKGATVATSAFGVASKASFGWIGLAITGVSALVAGLNYMAGATDRAKEKISSLNQEITQLSTDSKTAKELAKQYDELNKVAKAQGLNNEEQIEFIRIQNELKSLVPEINGYYDEQGNFIATETDMVKKLNEVYDELIAKKREEKAETSKGLLKDYQKDYNDLQKEIENNYKPMVEQIQNIMNGTESARGTIYAFFGLDELNESLSSAQTLLNDATSSQFQITKDMKQAILDSIYATESWNNATDEQTDAVAKFISNLESEELLRYVDAMNDGTLSSDDFVSELLKLPEVQNAVNEAFQDTSRAIESARELFGDASDKIATLNAISKELEESNGLSADSFKKIASEFPELLGYMNDEASLADAIKDKMESLSAVQGDAYRQMLFNSEEYYEQNVLGNEQMITSLSSGIENLFRNLSTAYQGDLNNWKTLAQGKADIETQLITSLNKEWEKHFGTLMTQFNKMPNTPIATPQFDEDKARNEIKAKNPHLTPGRVEALVNMARNDFKQQTDEYQEFQKEVIKRNQELANMFSDVKFDAVDIKIGGGGKIGSVSKSKSGSSSKGSFEKYYSQLIDEKIDIILSENERLENAIAFAQEKLTNAELKGDTKQQEVLNKQIFEFTKQKKELTHKMAEELRKVGNDVRIQLGNMNIKGYENFNFANLTELDVAQINQAFEKQIEKATESDKASLEQRKSAFNEYANAIIRIYQEELPEASRAWWTLENELIEQNTQKLTRNYEKQMSDLDKVLKGIDLEQVFMTDGSDEWFASELKRIDIIYEKKVKTEEMIRKLKEQNYSEESKEVQDLMSQAEDYELQMRQLIRQRAEARKSETISSLNKELENYKEQEKAITTLHDMVMQMLKDEQNAKKEALEEERDLMRKRIQEEIDGYEKIINKKKESLRKEQSDRNYEKGLKERQKKIADTEKKIIDLSADNSNASQAEKKRLEAELQQYREELEEYQYDHSIEMREEALDKELEAFKDEKEKELKAYEEQLDKQLKEIEEFVKNEGKLRQEALKLIEEKNRELYDRLIAWNKEYGVTNACPPSTEMCFEKHTYMQVSPKALHYNT